MKLALKQIKRDHTLSPRRKTSPKIAEKYAQCFEQLPPIVVFKVPDETKYLLVDGWHRYRAAEILGLNEVPVDKKAGSLEEAREYALLANLKHGLPLSRKERRYVIAEFLKLYPERSNNWIAEDLGVGQELVGTIRNELEEGSRIETLKTLIGKDGKHYPRTIEQPVIETQDEGEAEFGREDVEEPSPDVYVPTLGIYELNKAHQVDAIEGLMGLPDMSVDLIFADPPYNLGKKYSEAFKDSYEEAEYLQWCMQWFTWAYRVLKPGGAFYVMHYPEAVAKWKQQLDPLFTFRRWLSWVYPSNIGHSGADNWRRSHRAILYYTKGSKPLFFDGEADPQPYKNPEDIRVAHLGKEGTTPYDWWEYDLVKNVSKQKTTWPNQLPEDLVRRIVLTSCPENGIVCDPFIGSGTTGLVCAKNARQWIGFDNQAKAIEITMKRIEAGQ